jgi:hypothetical protein
MSTTGEQSYLPNGEVQACPRTHAPRRQLQQGAGLVMVVGEKDVSHVIKTLKQPGKEQPTKA